MSNKYIVSEQMEKIYNILKNKTNWNPTLWACDGDEINGPKIRIYLKNLGKNVTIFIENEWFVSGQISEDEKCLNFLFQGCRIRAFTGTPHGYNWQLWRRKTITKQIMIKLNHLKLINKNVNKLKWESIELDKVWTTKDGRKPRKQTMTPKGLLDDPDKPPEQIKLNLKYI